MKPLLCAFVASMMALSLMGYSDDTEAVRERMQKREPRLEKLKEQGVVGENNRGFVELRGEGPEDARELVESENRDRETSYAAEAAKSQSPHDQIARNRAQEIVGRSKPGTWVQEKSGEWRRKQE